MKRFSLAIVLSVIILGCGSTGETGKSSTTEAHEAAGLAAATRKRTNTDSPTAIPQRPLGENELRVSLLVLPGDALVEVDKVPALRRNGMVELVGNVGDEHRVEVFLDAATKIEKIVKIEATGVSPALIDAEEEIKVKSGPAKSPVVFDNDE